MHRTEKAFHKGRSGKGKEKAFIGLYVKRDTKEKDGLAVIELETM